MLDEAQWKAKTEERLAEITRKERLTKRSVDRVVIGDKASESEHGLKGERTEAGQFGGRSWRHATGGGWFAYEMKVLSERPVESWLTTGGATPGDASLTSWSTARRSPPRSSK